MTVHLNVMFLNLSCFLQSWLLEMIFEEQHDLDHAKENVNILQRGLLRPSYFLQHFAIVFCISHVLNVYFCFLFISLL